MESSISGPILAAAAAIAAAAIAGSFSYLNLITAKEAKVSEFRQQWIDALRASIAEYLSAFSYISILYKHFSEKDGEKKDRFEMAKEVQDTYSRVNRSYNDIILRINASESDLEGQELNDAFLAALAKTREHYNRSRYMEAFRACDAVRDAGKPLLKFEWKRVKRGEPSYNNAKRVAFSVLVAGLVAAVGLAVLVAVGGAAVEQEGEFAPLELKVREGNPKPQQNREPNK
ncbi:hypothetical protein AO735_08545 [Pseudomonas sp. TTU2014-096BSC]|nr:hypothetical protein AO735_08545 [Pseudomonas sp. TTU2014-096BSC]MCQ4266753.1 hypothetical protein [Stutzerimonas degradans]